jgi:hypothetical protein
VYAEVIDGENRSSLIRKELCRVVTQQGYTLPHHEKEEKTKERNLKIRRQVIKRGGDNAKEQV